MRRPLVSKCQPDRRPRRQRPSLTTYRLTSLLLRASRHSAGLSPIKHRLFHKAGGQNQKGISQSKLAPIVSITRDKDIRNEKEKNKNNTSKQACNT